MASMLATLDTLFATMALGLYMVFMVVGAFWLSAMALRRRFFVPELLGFVTLCAIEFALLRWLQR